MNRSRRSHLHSPFRQANSSSTSLAGMEKPIRSFKSFVKNVPPIRINNRALPQNPSADKDPSPLPSTTHPVLARPTSSQQSRLLPIYESEPDLGPPRTTPKSSLPSLPLPSVKVNEVEFPRHPPPTQASCPGPNRNVKRNPWTESSVGSNLSQRSHEKTHGTSGSNPSNRLQESPNIPRKEPAGQGSKHDRTVRQYLKGKERRALNKGSPLAEDSLGGQDMDDRARQLRCFQGYHELFIDPYQGLSVSQEEVLRKGPPHLGSPSVLEGQRLYVKQHRHNHRLVPRPLSWQSSSAGSNPRRDSLNENRKPLLHSEASPEVNKEKNHRRSWVPERLSFGVRRDRSYSTSTIQSAESHGSKGTNKESQIPESQVEKLLKQHPRFFEFYLRWKLPIKKSAKRKEQTEPPNCAATPQLLEPLIRLPRGFVIVRAFPSPAPKSKPPGSRSTIAISFGTGGASDNVTSPTSPNPITPEHHSSLTSSKKNQRAPREPEGEQSTLTAVIYAEVASQSQHSRGSEHSAAQESSSSPKSMVSWRKFRGDENDRDENKPGFIKKAREARRKHNQQIRQDKLKKIIQVLGPTDPSVVAGYVKSPESAIGGDSRMLGYLVRNEMA
ncbi:uncharacterized protein BDR25DRAFT_99143 [Lindgomyces ingoldianus]|uniref:Uncharacterized protein n=1 Tax=Lindgomyces ingoldianus TaxID=673940 RepID=A0ACB6QAU9_9PLEO|nr:uncharacterized protein BDR25DRAFT_99143 [Lindgomyces ingoldianus]KAF2464049.1 hypothetical protein BDR25DRAFT_99143 [Lindgomyces ingoldianus]